MVDSYSVSSLVRGKSNVGGLVGELYSASKIKNSYTNNFVRGSDRNIGGLVGLMRIAYSPNQVRNSYSSGLVDGASPDSDVNGDGFPDGALLAQGEHMGGLIGFVQDPNGVVVINSYYDKETSDQNDHGKGIALSTEEFLSIASFDPSWNINRSSDMDFPWVQNEENSRPYMYSQNVAISNGDRLSNELTSYVASDQDITSRGIRYIKFLDYDYVYIDNKYWTEFESPNKSVGKDVIDMSSVLKDDTLYFVQSFVKINNSIYSGESVKYINFVNTVPSNPEANEVYISRVDTSNELRGNYRYFQSSGLDESNSIYKWYISDDIEGANKTVISDATESTLLLTLDDQEKYYSFEVTPNNEFGFGEPVESPIYYTRKFQAIENFELQESATKHDVIMLDAVSSSGLDVVYTSSNPLFAIIVDGNTILAINNGYVSITASQHGDDVYGSAVSISKDLIIDPPLGIHEQVLENNHINVYPNPVIDMLTIDLNKSSLIKTDYSVSIYGISGALVYRITHQNQEVLNIYMGDKPMGVYFVKISSDQGVSVKKIIKQ